MLKTQVEYCRKKEKQIEKWGVEINDKTPTTTQLCDRSPSVVSKIFIVEIKIKD